MTVLGCALVAAVGSASNGASLSGLSAGSLVAESAESPLAATPQQLREDAQSRSEYEGLRGDGAVALAKRVFGVERPSVPMPGAAPGSSLGRYLADNAVVEHTPDGASAVVESSFPLRLQTRSGLRPTSLALSDDGESYVPQNPIVPIAISTHASGGVTFADGIDVAPIGVSAAEAPVLAGETVVYPNAARDTDLMYEPRLAGADISWLLRSKESPSEESVRFSLPAGAKLQQDPADPGEVEVLDGGEQLLLVPPAGATDASGEEVPVSYTIDGDVLTTHVTLGETVDYPVKVDPQVFQGAYGVDFGAGSWGDWQHESNYPSTEHSNGFVLGVTSSALIWESGTGSFPSGAYGKFWVSAPGTTGKAGSAGVSRVDVVGAKHNHEHESWFRARMLGSNGKQPSWRTEGSKREGVGTFSQEAYLGGEDITFCAEKGPSEAEPCNLGYQASSFEFLDELDATTLANKNFSSIEGALVTYRDATSPDKATLSHPGYEEGHWLKTAPANFTLEYEDEGLGIAEIGLVNGEDKPIVEENLGCAVKSGFTGCPTTVTRGVSFTKFENSEPRTGEIALIPTATDAAANGRNGTPVTLDLDQTKPVIGTLGGSLAEAAGQVIGSGSYTLSFSAKDGDGNRPQSGMRTLEVQVDGKTVETITTTCPEPRKRPEERCFSLSGSWTMQGQTFGGGTHTVAVVAKDWVGNVSEKSFSVIVNEAGYEPVGPGAVNLQTGDFRLTPSDVSIDAGPVELGLDRVYDSRKLSQGASGPLGPQWLLSMPDATAGGEWQSLTELSNKYVSATTVQGQQIVFSSTGDGHYKSPAGYQNDSLVFTNQSGPSEFKITDADGDYTTFERPTGASAFYPARTVQAGSAGGLNKVTYLFTTKEGITEPTQELAPEPSAGACTAKLVQGCRALVFAYATSTTATGETESGWGEYKGRLAKVSLTAWEPAKGEMTSTAVAQYSYDNKGQLRAEWDPRVASSTDCGKACPALKARYGYDSEGRLSALSPAGQQPWLMRYGATASDSSPGRLLSVSRFGPTTTLWNGAATLTDTTAPTLSTSSPVAGAALSIGNGAWSATAAYGYQWERCNYSGGECAPIAGATNETYTPLESDLGYTLAGQLTATNASGSVTVTTAVSSPVISPPPVYGGAFGEGGSGAGQMSYPSASAIGLGGYVWVADAGNHRVELFSPNGTFEEALGWGVRNGAAELQVCSESCRAGISGSGPGQLEDPSGIAVGPGGKLYVADAGDGEIQEYRPFVYPSYEWVATFGGEGTAEGKLKDEHGIALDSSGDVWVADSENNRVEEFSGNGAFMKSIGKAGTGHGEFIGTLGVAVMGGNLYVTDIENDRVQELTTSGTWIREFGKTGSEEERLSYPFAIAADPADGDLYVSTIGTSQVKAYTQTGAFVESLGTWGSGKEDFDSPDGIAIEADGKIFVADEYNDRVDIAAPPMPTEEPTQPAPKPGTTSVATIEYDVPLSGSAAPRQMSEAEVAKWGQKDKPSEATAIFPPDEPQSWPAGDYKRAEVYYLDATNRTVNTASPTGAVATTEYNVANDNVERTLSADNRKAALEDGARSVEVAEQLSTASSYSSDGTELTSVLGPQHTVKLATGATVQARKHTRYEYDENAPGGGIYHLVTKTTEGALTSEGEKEVRTVENHYEGQEDLGWKLHQPTETLTGSSSGWLRTTSTYSPSTGATTETDKAQSAVSITQYELPEGSRPSGIVAGPEGAMWFTDFGTGMVGKISSGHVSEYKAEQGKTRGITLGSDGNLWFVGEEGQQLDKMTPAGSASHYTLSRSAPRDRGITTGPEGDLWFPEPADNYIVKMTPKGEVAGEYPVASASRPEEITTGSDGNLWFTESESNKVGKITPSGALTEYSLPTGSPTAIAKGPDGNVWITESNGRLVKMTTSGAKTEYSLPEGSQPTSIAAGPDGNLWVTANGTSKILRISTSGEVIEALATLTGGSPEQITAGPEGNMWFTELASGALGEVNLGDLGNRGAHDSQTVYYAAGEAGGSCGKHPEWAGLPCETKLAAQPGTSGLPSIPVTTYTYNVWDEPLKAVDTIGETTRTTTFAYDSAGRLLTKAIAATHSSDKAVPATVNEYNPSTGALQKQSTSEGEAESVSSEENTLGQITRYTDAAGSKTSFEYEKEGDDRLATVYAGEGSSQASSQIYRYDTTSGFLTGIQDEGHHGAGIFSAEYDVEGNLTSEIWPNGVIEKTAYNAVGEATSREYGRSPTIFYSDSVTPSIHGQWLAQTSSFIKDTYAYDEAGRLTEVTETPTGEGCTSRLYAYDEDGNRTSLTTRAPGSEGRCSSEGGTVQPYVYDTADRLLGSGVGYETFGNTTSLPGAYAGGSPLSSAYYVDDMLASEEQNGQKIAYTPDLQGRTRQTVATGAESATTTYHYDSPGEAPTWTTSSTGAWSREVTGIDGGLIGIEENGGTPVLQIADLRGDIVGTIADSETAKFQSAKEASEYGVPKTTITSKYAWNGESQEPTELPTGIIDMGARAYVPALGRFEQTDPQPGGSINSYAYTADDPVNETDPSGSEWTYHEENFHAVGGSGSLPETFIGPGAITPAEVQAQAEAAVANDPPLEAVNLFLEGIEEGGPPRAVAAHAQGCWYGAYHIFVCHRTGGEGQGECLVTFAGHISSCGEVLARAQHEYAVDNNQIQKVKEYISALKEAIKYAKAELPPPP